jgi:hypothetical protein
MGRKSSIHILDPRLKEAVDAAITEGRATIEDIVQLVRGMGGEVSKSAVGRYKRNFEDSLTRYREAQQVAGRWVAQFKADPNSDVGRLLAEMVKTMAFQSLAAAGDSEDLPNGLELSRLARAVKALTDTDRVKAELEARARADAADAAAKAVEREGKAAGLDKAKLAEAVRRIREDVYGIVPVPPAGGAA